MFHTIIFNPWGRFLKNVDIEYSMSRTLEAGVVLSLIPGQAKSITEQSIILMNGEDDDYYTSIVY